MRKSNAQVAIQFALYSNDLRLPSRVFSVGHRGVNRCEVFEAIGHLLGVRELGVLYGPGFVGIVDCAL